MIGLLLRFVFSLLLLFGCDSIEEPNYFGLVVHGSTRRDIDGIDNAQRYVHCSGEYAINTIFVNMNGTLQTRWYIVSSNVESRRIYGTIQVSSSPSSLHVQPWTVIATKEKLPRMSLGVLPRNCTIHHDSLSSVQRLLVNLHNGCAPDMASIKHLLSQPPLLPLGLMPLCVYLETTASVITSHKCYMALLSNKTDVVLDEELAVLSSVTALLSHRSSQSYAIPTIPRLLLCLTSSDHVTAEEHACVRSTVAIYHSYAIIRSSMDFAHLNDMLPFLKEESHFSRFGNESLCVSHLISVMFGDAIIREISVDGNACHKICTLIALQKSEVHQSLCHFSAHDFDVDAAVALSSALMNTGARELSLSLLQRLVVQDTARYGVDDSVSVGVMRNYGTQDEIVSNISRRLLPSYISAVMQYYSPVISNSHNASYQTKQLWSALSGFWQYCTSHVCRLLWSDLSGAYRGAFLLAYQGKSHYTLYKDWYIPQILMRLATSEETCLLRPVDQNTLPRVRVAFLSTFFFRHSVGRLLGDVILNINRTVFDIHLVIPKASIEEDVRKDDLYSSLISQFTVHYVTPYNFSALPSIDIVVFGDLYMHQFTTYLSYHRLAPIQVVFWGHPYPSGSDHLCGHIDYFVSSSLFTPSFAMNSQLNTYEFGEQLVLFDSLSAHFLPSANAPPSHIDSREELLKWLHVNAVDLRGQPLRYYTALDAYVSRRAGVTVYTCLQSLMKMHTRFDEVFVEILQRDANALILLQKSDAQLVNQNILYNRLLHTLTKKNISLGRIVFVPQVSPLVYEQLVCAGDVTLDPFPFGGGITLSDSIRCNVPFVTSPYLQAVHSIGTGIASYFSTDMVAGDVIDYAQKAINLGTATKMCRMSRHKYYLCNESVPCSIHTEICENKEKVFSTGKTSVSEEWQTFLLRSLQQQS